MSRNNRLVWRPSEISALHTPEALFENSQRILGRLAAAGHEWAVSMQNETIDAANMHVGEHRRAPRRRLRRAFAAGVLAFSMAVTGGASGPTSGKARTVATGVAASPGHSPGSFTPILPPQEKNFPPRQPSPTECVAYGPGDTIWGLAEERVAKVVGTKAIGRVPMINIAKTIAADSLPEGTDPNVLAGEGCVQLPTERVIGGLYFASQHPNADPELTRAMERTNAHNTLANALDDRVSLIEIHEASRRIATAT